MENPEMVLSEGISAQDFYDLSESYGISGVPDTVINGKGRVLDIQPDKVHQRVPLFVGSKNEVDYLMSCLK